MIRKHTIVISRDKQNRITGIMLEKDWFSSAFANAFEYRTLEERKQGQFWFLSPNVPVTQTQAKMFTDNILQGKIKVIDLQQFSTNLARGK